MFNCPTTPAFNIIETVFADMKYDIRKKNYTESQDLIQGARNFLNTLDKNYMKKRLAQACKFFIKAIKSEEF